MSASEALVLWCRVSRPFSRTPVKLPLAADSSNEVPSSNAPQQVPAPPAWTPMRAQAMTPQTGGLRGFGLKRMREGEGTPGTPGTPLLQAGQASEAVRRIRQRSDKVCTHLAPLPIPGKGAMLCLSLTSAYVQVSHVLSTRLSKCIPAASKSVFSWNTLTV